MENWEVISEHRVRKNVKNKTAYFLVGEFWFLIVMKQMKLDINFFFLILQGFYTFVKKFHLPTFNEE